MDLAYFHLWSAGYLLPAVVVKPRDGDKAAGPAAVVPRRGKKAARAKRERVST
jgi:hypothetical protein